MSHGFKLGDRAKASLHLPDGVKWQDRLASLPLGAKIAVLEGDATKSGPFEFRVKVPDGYRIRLLPEKLPESGEFRFQRELQEYSRNFRNALIPEPTQNVPDRLAIWCSVLRAVFRRAEGGCPAQIMTKVYRLVDLCVSGLLEQGWCLMDESSGRVGVTNRAATCRGSEDRADTHG